MPLTGNDEHGCGKKDTWGTFERQNLKMDMKSWSINIKATKAIKLSSPKFESSHPKAQALIVPTSSSRFLLYSLVLAWAIDPNFSQKCLHELTRLLRKARKRTNAASVSLFAQLTNVLRLQNEAAGGSTARRFRDWWVGSNLHERLHAGWCTTFTAQRV